MRRWRKPFDYAQGEFFLIFWGFYLPPLASVVNVQIGPGVLPWALISSMRQ